MCTCVFLLLVLSSRCAAKSFSRAHALQIFGNIRLDSGTEINRHNNFRTFIYSVGLLFR